MCFRPHNLLSFGLVQELGRALDDQIRRPAQEGFACQAIVDEARRERALKRLRDRAVPIKSVAQELGFSEATNFCKAFERWTGMSPGEYRDIHAVGEGEFESVIVGERDVAIRLLALMSQDGVTRHG